MRTFFETKNMWRTSLRLALCSLALGAGMPMMAQLKTLKGTIIDQVSKTPLAGIQLQALGNLRYTAMTDEKGEFTIKVPLRVKPSSLTSPPHAMV